jgi:hypothetical protein
MDEINEVVSSVDVAEGESYNTNDRRRPGKSGWVRVFFHIVIFTAWMTPAVAQDADPGVSFGNLPVLQPATPQPGYSHIQGDFNGDGMSDVLWFNPEASQIGYWTMAIGVPTAVDRAINRTSSRSWQVTDGYFAGAVGDFNGDGYADIVFTSAARDLWLWTNDKQGHFKSTRIYDYPEGWQLIGSGDVDGDGYDDLLWLNPGACQFAYWRMQGGTRIGSKTVAIACGYRPVGVGYYTPTSRLSILWTSPAHDFYVWDGTGTGFRSYDFSIYVDTSEVWAFGGGYAGTEIGIEHWDKVNNTYGDAQIMTRTFDAEGRQTGVEVAQSWTGAAGPLVGNAGYAILGKGKNVTGLYMMDQGTWTLSSSGVTGTLFSGNAPAPNHYVLTWAYPAGWYVVGAPANGGSVLPWN